jgi:hypothetical protein
MLFVVLQQPHIREDVFIFGLQQQPAAAATCSCRFSLEDYDVNYGASTVQILRCIVFRPQHRFVYLYRSLYEHFSLGAIHKVTNLKDRSSTHSLCLCFLFWLMREKYILLEVNLFMQASCNCLPHGNQVVLSLL